MSDELIEALTATHNDTWPLQTGHGSLINEDGPEAAAEITRLRSLLGEAREGLEDNKNLGWFISMARKNRDHAQADWLDQFTTRLRSLIARIGEGSDGKE